MMEPMLAVIVTDPPTEEAVTYKDVDPEKGHEENPVKSRWVMFKNSPKGKPRHDA